MKTIKSKTWLQKSKSYLKEIQLEKIASPYSKGLAVSMIKGRYQLYTDQVIYSFEDLYKNFKITADQIDWQVFKPKEVLVLGLGLGSVIQIIEKKIKHPILITAVDIDESAMYLTHKYTAAKFKSPIEYVVADAHAYILQIKRKFDLIIFDVFIDEIIPAKFETLLFTKKLNSTLHPGGLVLLNRIASGAEQIMHNMEYMDQIFNKVWPLAGFVDVPPNWILVSNKKYLLPK